MRILLATDGSEASHTAEWLLLRLPFPEAVELAVAHVTLVPSLAHLRHEFPASVNDVLEEYQGWAESVIADEAARFTGMNGTVTTHSRSGSPAHELVELATELKSELIVIGARGLSPTNRLLMGSVSQKVVRKAPCSVLVTRPSQTMTESGRPLRIVCCLDGSPSACLAAKELSKFHWGDGVEITLLSTVATMKEYGEKVYERTQPLREEQTRFVQESHDWAKDLLAPHTTNVRSEIRESVHVAGEIVNVLEEQQADLVVLGHRGMNRIERWMLGSTSEMVMRHAPCSVWIVRGDDDE